MIMLDVEDKEKQTLGEAIIDISIKKVYEMVIDLESVCTFDELANVLEDAGNYFSSLAEGVPDE